MKKIRDFCLSPLFLIVVQVILTGAIVVGAVYFAEINVIRYRLWKLVWVDLTFVLCCGGMFALTYFEKETDAKAWHLVFPFLIGAGIFSALFFGLQAILDLFVNRTISCLAGATVALAFDLACVIAQDLFIVKRSGKRFLWATAPVVFVVYVGALLLSMAILPKGWVFKTFSDDTHEFVRRDAASYAVTDADRQSGRDFLTAHLSGKNILPVFDFSIGGDSFREHFSEWTSGASEMTVAANGDIACTRAFTKDGVEVTLEAAYYDLTATVEWTVSVANRAAVNSPVLSDLYALDAELPLDASEVYFSGGSAEANDDYALYSRELTSKGYTFDTVRGRTSMLYLPFFNLAGEDRGATIGIGWSGEWTATFAAEEGTTARVGQSTLCGYLEPGESVRTPLVSLCLYEGDALKGFNNFRADILRGLPEGCGEGSFLMFAGAAGQDDTSKATAAGATAYLQALSAAGILGALDYAWYDASWYDTKGADWRDTIGDWAVDLGKYPQGLGAVSDELRAKDVGMLLWYEPERVPLSSSLYAEVSADEKKSSWIILPANGSTNALWNMGDPDARQYMTDKIVASLKENRVSYYRQDFNIDPKTYWERADRELYDGRQGFAENKYVVGEYAFLDALVEAIPGLLIDNCASGGRRIDLEMCRRAIPLWRSDYQCKKEKTDLSEAAQYQTYGLSLWLPYSCITDPTATSEYDMRSLLGGCVMFYADILDDPETTARYVRFLDDYETIKTYFAQNYYPLTPCTLRSDTVAMQFGTEQEGVILLYAREGAGGDVTLAANGLASDKNYSIRTIEGVSVATGTGQTLMQNGFAVETTESTAYILLYKLQ